MSEPKPESFWDHVENLMPYEDCLEDLSALIYESYSFPCNSTH